MERRKTIGSMSSSSRRNGSRRSSLSKRRKVRDELLLRLDYLYLEGGRTIVRQGREAGAMYFIVIGTVQSDHARPDPIFSDELIHDIDKFGNRTIHNCTPLLNECYPLTKEGAEMMGGHRLTMNYQFKRKATPQSVVANRQLTIISQVRATRSTRSKLCQPNQSYSKVNQLCHAQFALHVGQISGQSTIVACQRDLQNLRESLQQKDFWVWKLHFTSRMLTILDQALMIDTVTIDDKTRTDHQQSISFRNGLMLRQLLTCNGVHGIHKLYMEYLRRSLSKLNKSTKKNWRFMSIECIK
ncbi:unnamed protein product [Nesidiocoris tenuis]|uniref:Cyclic nucleotide-binding domain-containing protein n=1 Tax=Nesidiocoris tenuis TaxID=355587 RepID=A0A6H5HDY9_9HEMI|nr:unnamed protein product [Nesidiocoris tenuis]